MTNLIQFGNKLMNTSMQEVHLSIDLIESSDVVKLNVLCKVSNRSDGRGSGVMIGRFIKDRGKWLKFKSSTGYTECICKWDIQSGGYKIEYSY